jgi:hypothetical protein
MMKRSLLGILLAVCACGNGLAAEPAAGPEQAKDWPYGRPEYRRLMEAVTLHVSFDRQRLTPDMAEGERFVPNFAGSNPPGSPPRFAPGVVGQALVLGSGVAMYPRAGNVLLEKRGALALWVRPENWQRPRDGNCEFIMTTNARFYLQRQGPDLDDQGRVRRLEGVQYLIFLPDNHHAGIVEDAPWENGRWYLLVANWSWPTLELSVNGEPFKVAALASLPGKGTFGDLVVGNRNGTPRGLLDEVMAFRRPLTLEEVKLLDQLRPR